MNPGKYWANRGVKRNKKPLRNIQIWVTLLDSIKLPRPENYLKYKFKDLGYLYYHWNYEGDQHKYIGGFITPDELKTKLTLNQWSKFCSGRREFVVQRRVNGKNI